MPASEKPCVSVVIPCYRSSGTIGKVVRLTREELIRGGYDYEFVLVNDKSPDATYEAIAQLAEEDPNVVAIDFAKNQGQHNALMAGLRHAQGDYMLLMDDDMQTHPSQCLKLVDELHAGGHDVVFARWKEHKEAWWRLLGSNFATWSMRVMTHRPKEIYSSNFLVMRKHVRDEVIRYEGPYVYIQGLIFRSTANIVNVDVEHFDREQGTSGYTLKTLMRLWFAILNFSMMPLRLASILGIAFGLIGFFSGVGVVIAKILNPAMAAGWPSIMAVLLFCSGIILMSLGFIGEYLGRVFMTVNKAPQYVVREKVDHRD